MTDWLSAEFAVGRGTAREWVFLSKALRRLPRIFDAYARGLLTWEQLCPLVRFATAETDAHWAEAASRMYPSQLWRENERRTRLGLKEDRDIHASRSLSLIWDRDRPVLYLQGRFGKEQGSALEEALLRHAPDVPVDPGADDPTEARSADALVELATGGSANGESAPRDRLVIHTDVAVLTRTAPRTGPWLGETDAGRRLHSETIRRLACDANIDLLFEDGGRPVGIARSGRRVPAWLERVVRHRDGGACRFPGCERRLRLLSHHIKHWGDGGPTEVDNLVTLCATHHRYVHEDGWRIAGHPHSELRFHDPTGRALRRAPPPAAA